VINYKESGLSAGLRARSMLKKAVRRQQTERNLQNLPLGEIS